MKIISKTGQKIILKKQKDGTVVLIGNKIKFLPFEIDKSLEFIKRIGII